MQLKELVPYLEDYHRLRKVKIDLTIAVDAAFKRENHCFHQDTMYFLRHDLNDRLKRLEEVLGELEDMEVREVVSETTLVEGS